MSSIFPVKNHILSSSFLSVATQQICLTWFLIVLFFCGGSKLLFFLSNELNEKRMHSFRFGRIYLSYIATKSWYQRRRAEGINKNGCRRREK
jgi:hypothetical protein